MSRHISSVASFPFAWFAVLHLQALKFSFKCIHLLCILVTQFLLFILYSPFYNLLHSFFKAFWFPCQFLLLSEQLLHMQGLSSSCCKLSSVRLAFY